MDKNRRGFMTWLAGFFGLGAVAEVAKSESWSLPTPIVPKGKAKGFIALTLNVHQLPPFKAEAFVERVKEQWRKQDLRKTLDDWEIIILPVRNQETKIEIFAFDGLRPCGDEYVNAQKLLRDDTPFKLPDKCLAIDIVQMMIGAPVCKVELDATQLEVAYDQTKELFERVGKSKGMGAVNRDGMGQEVFKNIILAKATIALAEAHLIMFPLSANMPQHTTAARAKCTARIRGAHSWTGLTMVMVKEGNENLIYWTQYLDAI